MDISEQLAKLGLSSKAALAYMALLKLQKANPHQIASEANIERTTIYNVMEDLCELGLASKVIQGRRITFQAEPPSQLQVLAEDQLKTAQNLVPMLSAMQGKSESKPVVHYYTNKQAIQTMLLKSLEATEPLRREFALVENVVDFLGARFAAHYISERVRKKILLRSIRHTPQAKITNKSWYFKENNPELLREIRYLEESIAVAPWMLLYDSSITVISSQKESFALVIESSEYSDFLKSVFDILWKVAKPNKKS